MAEDKTQWSVTGNLNTVGEISGTVMKTAKLVEEGYDYAIDASKIETLEDVKLILSKIPIALTPSAIKGIEHLVTKRVKYGLR